MKGMKWSWAHATNNRPLATERGRMPRGLSFQTTLQNPMTSKLGSRPKADIQGRTTDCSQSKIGSHGWGYRAMSHLRPQKTAKYPRSGRGGPEVATWEESSTSGSYMYTFFLQNKPTLTLGASGLIGTKADSSWFKATR